MLHFLNKLDFIGYLGNDDNVTFTCIKKVLVDEFLDVSSEKFISMFDILDDLYILFVTQDLENVKILTGSIRSNIFLLVEEKMKDEQIFPPILLCYMWMYVIEQLILLNGCERK